MYYTDQFDESGDPAECRRRHMLDRSGIEPLPGVIKRLYDRDIATKLLDKINSFADLKDFDKYYYNIYRGDALHHAIRCSNNDVAETLILRGADPNKQDRYFHTPLYYALTTDNETMVSLLLSNNVSATGIFCEYGVGIPTYYFEYVCKNSNTKIVELFLNNGCTANDDLFTSDQYSCERKSRPLHAAIMNRKIETVKILIKYGARVNQSNLLEETPLYLACMGGLRDIVIILLKNKAFANVVAMNNKTPLYQAIKSCDSHIVKLILENGGVVDDNICLSLPIVIKNGSVEIVKCLLDAGLNPNLRIQGSTFLHIALRYGQIDIIELLLKYGAELRRGDHIGCTSLHMAASMNKMELMKVLLDGDPHKGSIDKSVINVRDKYGGTAFQVACLMKSHDCMQLLMDYGADLTAANDKGDTAFHLAAESTSINVIKRLVDAKVPINVVNEYLNSPLHIAVMNNSEEIVECLLENKAATSCENNDRLIPLEVALTHGSRIDMMVISHLLRYADDINDSYHKRAFRLAMTQITEKEMANRVFDLFFKYGFTLNSKNEDINSLLYVAAKNGHATIVEMLLDLGADPNTKVNRESVLHATMKNKHDEIISILLKHGADPVSTDVENELALHDAIANGNSATFAVLIHKVDTKTLPQLLHYVVDQWPPNCSQFIRILVERGVDVDACYDGRNILLSRVSRFSIALSDEMKIKESRMLWEYGVDIRTLNENDPTPMFQNITDMYVILKVMEILLSYGADIHVRDSHGSLAMELLLTKVRNVPEIHGIVTLPIFMKLYKMHVAKLRHAGLYVHPKILQQLEPLSLEGFDEQCLKELQMLKRMRLNPYDSVYVLLSKNPIEVVRLTRGHDGLRQRVKKQLYSGNYPVYGNCLISKLARADMYDLYLPRVEDTLRRMCEKGLPDTCMDKITQYLDVEDFKNLATCGEV